MLEAVVSSFALVPGLPECRIIIMMDGYRVGSKPRHKSGVVTEEQGRGYEAFMLAVEGLAAGHPSFAGRTTTYRMPERVGFACSLRAAISTLIGCGGDISAGRGTPTPTVLVVQHDYMFVREVDIRPMVQSVLQTIDGGGGADVVDRPVHYISLLSTSTMDYVIRMATKYKMQLQPFVRPLKAWLQGDEAPGSASAGGNLVPLLFWYDKPHIASVPYYWHAVLNTGILRKGDFVEDTFGQHMLADIKENGLEEHQAKYGSYIYDDTPLGTRPCRRSAAGNTVPMIPTVTKVGTNTVPMVTPPHSALDVRQGTPIIKHLDGRRWLTEKQRVDMFPHSKVHRAVAEIREARGS
jgi:hypothetical protein